MKNPKKIATQEPEKGPFDWLTPEKAERLTKPINWKSGDDNPVPEKKIYVKCTCLNSLEYSNCAKNCEQVQAENESTPVIEQKEIEAINKLASAITVEEFNSGLQPESKQLTPDTDIICPFCGEKDFDRIGLKNHFLVHPCKEYQETSLL